MELVNLRTDWAGELGGKRASSKERNQDAINKGTEPRSSGQTDSSNNEAEVFGRGEDPDSIRRFTGRGQNGRAVPTGRNKPKYLLSLEQGLFGSRQETFAVGRVPGGKHWRGYRVKSGERAVEAAGGGAVFEEPGA
jgi:hypothetical protein